MTLQAAVVDVISFFPLHSNFKEFSAKLLNFYKCPKQLYWFDSNTHHFKIAERLIFSFHSSASIDFLIHEIQFQSWYSLGGMRNIIINSKWNCCPHRRNCRHETTFNVRIWKLKCMSLCFQIRYLHISVLLIKDVIVY